MILLMKLPEKYELEDLMFISCASVIAASILLSLFFHLATIISHFRSGGIKLKNSINHDPTPLTWKDIVEQKLLDSIDEDTLNDGEPVGVQAFWMQVRLLKGALFILAAISTVFGVFSFLPIPYPGLPQLTQLIANLTISSYVLLLTLINLFVSSFNIHRTLTLHTFSMTFPLAVSQFFKTYGHYLLLHDQVVPWYDYVLLASTWILFILASCVSLGPKLHKDLVGLYSRAVNEALEKEPISSVPNVVARDNSSIVGTLLLNFMYPVMWKISKMEQVDIQDLPALRSKMRSTGFISEAMRKTSSLGKNKTMSAFRLTWILCKAQASNFVTAIVIFLAIIPGWYIPLIFQEQLLWILDNHPDKRISAGACAVLFLSTRFITSILSIQRINVEYMTLQPLFRLHSRYLLFQKLLSRNIFAKPEEDEEKKKKVKVVYSRAEILNLISSDTTNLGELPINVLELFTGQIEMIIGCIYLWKLLGWSGACGLASLFITWPAAYYLTKIEYRINEQQTKLEDENLSYMQEAIQAISMIKMTASELFWYNRITNVRNRQFQKSIEAEAINTLSAFLYTVSPIVVTVVSFAHYTLIAKKELTASIAFTSLSVFAELRPLFNDLPTRIAELLRQILSVRRISTFLSAQDLEIMSLPPLERPPTKDLYAKGSIAWDMTAAGSPKGFQLQDIDVHFPRGQMTLISGRVGSGKTLLLLALLGEARLVSGDISYVSSQILHPREFLGWDLDLNGVAYTPQSLSIRENILFGLPMNIERYRNVLHACALLPDLKILEDADLTEIGERGRILSGGQKARVSLARAMYSRAAVVLLDDVISAVDAQTSRHIIDHCFKSPLMAGRTIIIVSHAVEALAPMAEHAIYLDNGRVLFEGTGDELLKSEHMIHLKSAPASLDEREELKPKDKIAATFDPIQAPITFTEDVQGFEIKEQNPKTPRQLIVDENRQKGKVKAKYWVDLLKANGGIFFWTVAISGIVVSGLLLVARQEILAMWTRKATTSRTTHDTMYWLSIYTIISIFGVTIPEAGYFFRFLGSIGASKRYHAKMLDHLLRAKLDFFSKTRTGSIIQRFGKNLNQLRACSLLISSAFSLFVDILTSVVSVTVYGGWQFPLILILVAISLLRVRLYSIIPGTVNALYSETVAGAAVIRAFGVQCVFVNVTSFLWLIYTSNWLAAHFYLLSAVILGAALGLLLLRSETTGAEAGFVLSFTITIADSTNWLILRMRDYQSKGVSIERVTEYCNLPVEDTPELVDHGRVVPTFKPDWPVAGEIKVRNLRARYGSDMPDILHDVLFDVRGGQRVGIVGATGCGKSTLAKAFLSFVDVNGGHIDIDGTDIASLPLSQVRSNIGMIAQDPILLSGSLRLNLDLNGQFKDETIFAALRQVQLLQKRDEVGASEASSETLVESVESASADMNENIFADLDSEIKSGGENLSAGQKQLVVLARALLSQQRILILDEATASIDSITDAEISRVVHEEFRGVTVLIIAHRLRTIMPCSKILVMEKGKIIQQGSPLDLIDVDGGKFQSLCMAAGHEEYTHLRSLAEQSALADQFASDNV